MGSFGSARATMALITTASGYIPIATLVPLTMSWFGLDEKQKVVFLAMAFLFSLPMIVNRSLPDVYLRTAHAGRESLRCRRRSRAGGSPDIWHSCGWPLGSAGPAGAGGSGRETGGLEI
jgi:hypothetical protein